MRQPRRSIGGAADEVVMRADDAPAAGPRHQGRGRAVFDVDPLRAEVPGPFEDRDPGLLGAVEPSALVRRPAGGDDRQAASRERPVHVHVGDAVEAQLDQVGAGDGVAALEQLGHRGRRHGRAQQGSGHRGFCRQNEKRLFNRRVEEASSRSSWLVVRCYGRPGASSVKDQYQYQRAPTPAPGWPLPARLGHGSARDDIDRIIGERERYQTRCGSVNGAAAAP